MRLLSKALLPVFVLAMGLVTRADEPKTFPLQNGDVWVMAGDSITAQHLHSNYFEAFCFARYPQLKFSFRNSGVGGHTIPSTLARFDYDVAGWKPTVISVELGMNDAGGTSREAFLNNMKTWLQRVRSIQARPVLFSPSPVNDGSTMAKLATRNVRLSEYSTDLQTLADQEHLPYADQFHALVDIWGQNKENEQLSNFISSAKPFAAKDTIPGVNHLREFLKVQHDLPQKPISMQGDGVHPGPCGQLMMAAALLKGLGANGFVSSVALDADGKNLMAKGCQITEVNAGNGTLTFERLDDSLPFPIPADAASVLPMATDVFELSQYTLQVKGLQAGNYQLKLNGVLIAKLSAEDLSQGVNLTAYGPHMLPEKGNPLAVQGTAILNAVSAKEGLVSQWRGLSKAAASSKEANPATQQQLEELNQKIEAADAAIRHAAQPQKLKFEISAAS